MNSEPYIVGQVIELQTVFTNDDGDPIDPNAVTCKVLQPDGTVEEPSVSHVASGTYLAQFTPVQIGLHEYRFAGADADGAPVSAGEKAFLTTTDFGVGA